MFLPPHTVRMAPARSILTSVNHQSNVSSNGSNLPATYPYIHPTEDLLDRFWRRVAQLTTRYHDVERKWIGGEEIRQWNGLHLDPCNKCLNSKSGRPCILDEDQPSCRTCRLNKIGCDRKPLFVFDMTKDDFFPVYEQFLEIFKNKEAGRLRRYDKSAEPATQKRRSVKATKGKPLATNRVEWNNLDPESFLSSEFCRPQSSADSMSTRDTCYEETSDPDCLVNQAGAGICGQG
ncbi:hypothetical protein C8R46DRAFT_1207167 [Mycena filopes]|nr:hypothetical protein C8R46DRAFT_1207167 [Mycena filopes]